MFLRSRLLVAVDYISQLNFYFFKQKFGAIKKINTLTDVTS